MLLNTVARLRLLISSHTVIDEPLHHKKHDICDLFGCSQGILGADQLHSGNFHLSSYVVLGLSELKCVTLAFKAYPLQNIKASSTFESIMVTQKSSR